jgi:3-isopropylmalate dehydratase small subunit
MRDLEIVVVARSIARIFMQNAINLRVKLAICPTVEADDGDELELTPGKVRN